MSKHDCGTELELNGKHDATFCPACDEWTEVACKNPECEFCRDRPEKPSEVQEGEND